ncbi:hypothetical protein THRCLA_09594 [Thraustotheca clavata]|uniref:Uncharacterized protein n=1 Tax=Thraustotheca clavata TaxID=74557 RepID=A0A1V9YVL1_9STRA|nr:hypothetical protein THRCLA_09594 [Thraustotheca clavata]
MGNACAKIKLETVDTESLSSVHARQRHWTDSTQPSSASHAEEEREKKRFSFGGFKRQTSSFPIVQEQGTLEIGRARYKYTPMKKHELYRSDTTDEMTSIDIDLILGTPPDSPGVIHARWGEPAEDPDEEETCMDFKGNPFRVGFCINCQRQHEVDANGQVITTLEYKRISHFNAWQLQLPANPNMSVNPNAVVGVGRANISNSKRNLRLSNMSDSSRESDIDLTEILRQRRSILMKLQGLASPLKTKDQKQTKRTSTSDTTSNEDWL